MLKEGAAAPDFEATLSNGETFRLADHQGRKNVVLYFYPKDFTPGCTREACAFRDSYEDVERYDAVIVGVSNDSAESHDAFAKKHELPFPLIPDPEKRIISSYDAIGLLGLTTARVTYVIDKEGVVRAAIRHDLAVGRHLPEVLEALASIEAPSAA
ncbi:MAG: peroxiredoxin [Dehalococcoidia bacterium]|nr:peroxiredoxin [Dehalococcoidia bacterium]